jgi:two-component system, OmpR family, sensor histidine kinase BaeS
MRDHRRALGPIGTRVALATLVVAVGAIGVLASLTLISALGDVSKFARQQQDDASATIAGAVSDAYESGGSWDATDLHVAAALAGDADAVLTVFDAAGRPVPIPPDPGTVVPGVIQGPLRSSPVVHQGTRVGTVIVHFYRTALPAATTHLRDALVRTVVVSAGLAALLALGVAVILSRWITGPIVTLTDTIRSAEGGDRSARVGPIRAPDELAVLGAAFDRMADTIEREDTLRRAVAADVAHELRTPLAVLQANFEALTDGVTAPSPTNLSSLHDEVLRLARTVDDLDTLAVAESAALRLDTHAVDLCDVAARSMDALRPAYTHKGVRLEASLSPATALADPHRVDQILMNLLTNALKFTEPRGSVTVTVTTDQGAPAIVVTDTGVGIPPDEQAHVFERFWRGKEAGRLAGSGIGLAVVHALVDAHHGTVALTSTPSEGTRVRVELPRAEPTFVRASS